ncbi:Hypothetical protein SRAE_0000014000 [Strongyloides ratti]|uniref:Uncharacterized protein n=1 Tax=Strongyloides ratti TaxID=34506 RepID=A0A090MRY1_STRRB|nr:Hypothetical protein SRAE_0000014000 [Strongyloides ratti]CEF61008.1 Hypothetical protein SRAE_0000014000 [Strongyloides ratti]
MTIQPNTKNVYKQESSSLPSNNYLSSPTIKSNLTKQPSYSTFTNKTMNNSLTSNSLSISSTNMITKPIQLKNFASKTIQSMNTNKNDIFGSIKNMWDEGWQKIDNFLGGNNNIKYVQNFIPNSKKLYLTNVTYHLTIYPPSAWTYCEPYCGVEDQGVDAESVNDTINADVIESINEVFQSSLHLQSPNKDEIKIFFQPQNILGQGFGDFYDRKGQKYIISRGSVNGIITRGQLNQQKFTQSLIITFLTKYQMKEIKWENIGYLIIDKIKKIQKGLQLAERMKTTIELV